MQTSVELNAAKWWQRQHRIAHCGSLRPHLRLRPLFIQIIQQIHLKQWGVMKAPQAEKSKKQNPLLAQIITDHHHAAKATKRRY